MFNRIFTICCSTLNYTFCLCSLRSCRMQNLPLHLVLLLFDSAFESRLTGTRSFSLTALPIIAAHEIKCDSNHLKITSILEKKKKRCNGTPFCKNESKEWAKTIKNQQRRGVKIFCQYKQNAEQFDDWIIEDHVHNLSIGKGHLKTCQLVMIVMRRTRMVIHHCDEDDVLLQHET